MDKNKPASIALRLPPILNAILVVKTQEPIHRKK